MTGVILMNKTNKNIIELDEETVEQSNSLGMIKVYEYNA